jgi:hypothetical protein
MSMTLRFSPAAFLGMPPLAGLLARSFGARRAEAKAARVEPAMRKAAPAPATASPPRAAANGVDLDKLLNKARVAPKLALLEWDGDRASDLPALDFTPPAAAPAEDSAQAMDPRRRKIRDRYISARFPGLTRGSNDLRDAAAVVKSARLLFEEEQPELALELLRLATEEAPHEAQLWLASLEILFLLRDRDAFVRTARAFREAHRTHEAWAEVERLGRALVPGEPLFGATVGPRDHEHYGPWPHLPNWIQAPWDLTAEVVAADFHRAVTRMTARLAAAPN